MREYKSLAEWLRFSGNRKYHVGKRQNGEKVIVIANDDEPKPCFIFFDVKETKEGFTTHESLRIEKALLPAIIGLLGKENILPESTLINFNVVVWLVDDEDDFEGEAVIGTIEATSENHAKSLLKSFIAAGTYPEGAWLEFVEGA